MSGTPQHTAIGWRPSTAANPSHSWSAEGHGHGLGDGESESEGEGEGEWGGVSLVAHEVGLQLSNESADGERHEPRSPLSAILDLGAAAAARAEAEGGGGVRSRGAYRHSSPANLRSPTAGTDTAETPSSLLWSSSDNPAPRNSNRLRFREHSETPLNPTTSDSTPPHPSTPSSTPVGVARDRTNGFSHMPHSLRRRSVPRAGRSPDLHVFEDTIEGELADSESEVEMEVEEGATTLERRGAPSALASVTTTTTNNDIWNTTAAGSRWEDNLQSPPSFGSSGSQLSSSSVASDFGGAAITPRDTQATSIVGKELGLFAYEEIDTDDDDEGGISFDMEIDDDSVSVGAMHPSPAMAVDELLPSSFTTRSLSPVGGGGGELTETVQLLNGGAGGSEVSSTSAMQLDFEVEYPSPPSASGLFSSVPPSPASPTDPQAPTTPFSGPSSPSSDVATAASDEEEEQEMHIPPSQPTDNDESSPASPPTVPTPIAELIIDYPPTSFLENHPHIFAYPEYMTVPAFFPDLFTNPPTISHVASLVNLASAQAINPFDDHDEHPNDVIFDDALVTQEMDKYNSDFANFCGQLWHSQIPSIRDHYRCGNHSPPHISSEGLNIAEWSRTRPAEITREDVDIGSDIQGIQWDKLELGRKEARRWRQGRYINYRNIQSFTKEGRQQPIRSNREFFTFLRHNTLRCRLMHFQLRNVLALTDRNNIFFSNGDQVTSFHPVTNTIRQPFLDLSDEAHGDYYPIRISTLGACGGPDAVLMAGGFNGTFAIKPLNANISDPPITGAITGHENGITNHIQIIRSRRTSTPQAVICSNDNHIRILDIVDPRRRFISHHSFAWAVNCSATSPDSRLRAVVGDSKDVLIVDAERGRTEFTLPGHQDFGFAAAWSDDGYTIATGNQDQTVRIFDARNLSSTLKTFSMTMAGCRTLKFSPMGNGNRQVLAMAEPADLLHFVDTKTWEHAQTVSFWGEVGGLDFTPDGEQVVVANCDRYVGGVMTLQRKKGTDWYPDWTPDWEEKKTAEEEKFIEVDGGTRLGRRERTGKGGRWKRLGSGGLAVMV